jgi:hypothetical protein
MFVAYRVAGLSALDVHYAVGRATAQANAFDLIRRGAFCAGDCTAVGATGRGGLAQPDKMKIRLLSLPTLLTGLFAFSTPGVATNLIGDVILGSYNVPCAAATCNAFDQYEYSVNPFTVDAVSQETNLNIIDGDLNTGVDFNASSVVFTFQQDTTWNPFPFNGTEFAVVSGNPFGTVVSVTSPVGEPVDAYVSGGVLFVNWQGDSFKAGDMVTVAFGAPEPSTWAMMLLEFAGLGYAGYRGRHSSVAGAQ